MVSVDSFKPAFSNEPISPALPPLRGSPALSPVPVPCQLSFQLLIRFMPPPPLILNWTIDPINNCENMVERGRESLAAMSLRHTEASLPDCHTEHEPPPYSTPASAMQNNFF